MTDDNPPGAAVPVGAVERFVTRTLGRSRVVADHSRRSGRVVEVMDERSTRWIVKTPARRASYEAEVHAYEQWVPSVADRAPSLRAHDPRSATIILGWLPGVTGWTDDPEHHRAAGQVLARLHAAGRPAPVHTLAERMRRRLDAALVRAPAGVVADRHSRLAARSAAALAADHDDLEVVPCHGDPGPHNWLRHDDRVALIDYGDATPAPAAWDLARLFIGPWWERPDLSAAFFRGYGAVPDDRALTAVRLQLPTVAITLLARAALTGDLDLARRTHSRLDHLLDGFDPTAMPTAAEPARRGALATWQRIVRRYR